MLNWLRGLVGGNRAGSPVAATPPSRAAGRAADGIIARYDNAQTTGENSRNWWAADYLSAKAANSFQVRRVLRMRSRYEVSNNPYLFGIANNNADDLIGSGPTLQVKTPDASYNREVERVWAEWCAEVGFVEKLRTTKLAKTIDGEGFLVLKTVEDLESPVKLYPCDVEADQVTTPAPTNVAELWVDGLTLHPVTGRPTAYHVLRHHPGDFYFPDLNPLRVDKIPARHVVHWFSKFRPGQVRGVPVFTPSLDLFTELRAFRRAVLGAAEIAADFAAVIEQDKAVGAFADEDTDAELEAFKRVPIDRKMMTSLPPGAKMSQFKSENPSTSYEMFQEKCLGEACRPLSYPLNLALGTSQKFNFSSAKLDHINYRSGLTGERNDCDAAVLPKVFAEWFPEAVLSGAVRAFDGASVPPHEWHWPGFEPIDPKADADADHARLSNGSDTWKDFWARRGRDWKDVLKQQAEERDEIDKLGVRFGQPATLSVTEDGDTPDGEKAERAEHDPAAHRAAPGDQGGKPAAKPEKVAKKDKPDEKRDEKGEHDEKGDKAIDPAKKDDAEGIANTALNGAQITSLVAVIDKFVQKQYTPGAAKAIIQGAFPALPVKLIDTIIGELKDYDPPAPPEPEPGTPAADAKARLDAVIRAFDEGKVQRDANGKFSETGSSKDSSADLKERARGLASKVKKIGGKAVAVAKAAADKVRELAYRATWAYASGGVFADDVLETVHDHFKIANDKAMNQQIADSLGIPMNTAVQSAIVKIGAFAITKMKQAIASRREKKQAAKDEKPKSAGGTGITAAKGMTVEEKAKAAAEVLAVILTAMGVSKDNLPTAADVEKQIREKQEKDDADDKGEEEDAEEKSEKGEKAEAAGV